MTRRMRFGSFAALAIAAFTTSAFVGWQSHQTQPARAAAAWKTRFDSLPAMTRGVDVVALAEAVSTSPGRVAQSADGSDTLPFEITTFNVVAAVRGTSDGATLTVERAGGADESGAPVFIDADGGGFEPGRQYLLFLNRQEDGPYLYQVNDEGRFDVSAGRLRAVAPDGPAAAPLHGRGVDEALALLKAGGRQ